MKYRIEKSRKCIRDLLFKQYMMGKAAYIWKKIKKKTIKLKVQVITLSEKHIAITPAEEFSPLLNYTFQSGEVFFSSEDKEIIIKVELKQNDKHQLLFRIPGKALTFEHRNASRQIFQPKDLNTAIFEDEVIKSKDLILKVSDISSEAIGVLLKESEFENFLAKKTLFIKEMPYMKAKRRVYFDIIRVDRYRERTINSDPIVRVILKFQNPIGLVNIPNKESSIHLDKNSTAA